MAVTYTKDQRAYAKENHMMLGTIGTQRMMFQGPLDSGHVKLIEELMVRILKERKATKAEQRKRDEDNRRFSDDECLP